VEGNRTPHDRPSIDRSSEAPTLAGLEATTGGTTRRFGRRRRGAPPPRPSPAARSVSGASEGTLRLVTGDFSEIDARASHGPDRAAAPLADPLIGRVVADRYRILELVGRGGMGSVYQVEHTRIGKLLAMKLLSGELSQRPEAVRRFKREALAVSRLTSPNTVQVFDFGAADGLTYLVMELVRGQSLGDVVRATGPLPWARAARIVVQIASSLTEAHGLGIVHRDVKPENVMILPGEGGVDVAKVLDFGLAKLREPDDAEVTGHGMILGTPSYMAPEQIRGELVDGRSDLYALGALLYRLLTGEPPFRSDSALSVLSKHLHEPPVPPAERAPSLGIPAGVSRLVMRALRKRPEDRFQRVEDLQRELVAELDAAGSKSAEGLLDPGRVRRLALASVPDDVAIATRDEVDAYERRLRRTRKGALAAGVAVLAGAIGLAASALGARAEPPGDVELEPNDTAAQATPLALGHTRRGQIGRRLDATHGDRDVYAFDVAPGEGAAPLRLRLAGVPSMALCALVYQAGFTEPTGQYCAGKKDRDLVVDGLALAPGRHLVAVVQDLDGYGGEAPAIQESITDTYAITIEPSTVAPDQEREPNDAVAAATRLAPGHAVRAALGFTRDEDVFCVDGADGERVRVRVRPGAREALPLEVTPILDGQAGAPARARPEAGAFTTPVLPATAASRCVRVRRPRDPGSIGASAASEPYVIEIAAP
jgi:serine/threonine-protein kinase